MQTFIKDTVPRSRLFVLVGQSQCSLARRPKAEPLSVTLTGAQEVPPVKTLATATSRSPWRPTGGQWLHRYDGIEGTMAHIHMGALGMNGPVIVTLEKSSDTRWSVPEAPS